MLDVEGVPKNVSFTIVNNMNLIYVRLMGSFGCSKVFTPIAKRTDHAIMKAKD